MEILVPDLHSTGINHLSVCGRITAPDAKLRKWTRKHQDKYYIYQLKVENGLVYCRVGMDVHKDAETQKEYVHLHIDEGTKEAFKKTPVTSKNEIPMNQLLAPFLEQKIAAIISAHFNVDADMLPHIIRVTTKIGVERAGVAMKMTGGTLSAEGAPISIIEWSMPDKGNATVSMQGQTKLNVTSSYLEQCCNFVSSYADIFLERNNSNEDDNA